MTLTEIHQRLIKEFPDRYVSFIVTITTRQPSEDSEEDNPISVRIYADGLERLIPCSDLDDGINQLKLKLGLVQPEMRMEI